MKIKFSTIIIITISLTSAFLISQSLQPAAAASISLDDLVCHARFNGNWISSTNTCLVTSNNQLSSSDSLEIPSSTTLLITNIAGTGLFNNGTINNLGNITLANSGANTIGIDTSGGGSIINSGTLQVRSVNGFGINNGVLDIQPGICCIQGHLTNALKGQITIQTINGFGIINGGGLDNLGHITITNPNGIGILNGDGFFNSGIVIVSNSGGNGIFNLPISSQTVARVAVGTILNTGTIELKNTGNSVGLCSCVVDTAITNFGIIEVANSGNNGIEINNGGSLTNSGKITISNISGIGLNDNKGILDVGTVTNNPSSLIIVSNSGGVGINDDPGVFLINSGKIMICGGTVTGQVPTSGNSVIVGCDPDSITATKNLIGTINNLGLKKGTSDSLDAKLNDAIKALSAGDCMTSKIDLQSFISEVNAQTGKKLSKIQANTLIASATNIVKSLSC